MTDFVIDGAVMDRLRTTGIQGYVPVVDFEPDANGQIVAVPKLTPWWNDPIWRNRETGALGWHPEYEPGRAFQVQAPAPISEPAVRTTARQKYEVIVKLLTHEAIRFTQPDGSVAWPASVQAELDAASWRLAKPGQLTREEQVELLARNYIESASHKQKENDQHTVTLGYHGHSAA